MYELLPSQPVPLQRICVSAYKQSLDISIELRILCCFSNSKRHLKIITPCTNLKNEHSHLLLESSNTSQNNQGEECFPNSPQQTQGSTVGNCNFLVETKIFFNSKKKIGLCDFYVLFSSFSSLKLG